MHIRLMGCKPKPIKIHMSRKLRRSQTAAEAKAWRILRNRQVLGLKFRRQHVVDGFIVDFYCASENLVIELDGSVHDNPIAAEYDHFRSKHLATKGLSTLRVRNEDVCLTTITRRIESFLTQSAKKTPSPQGGEGARG
jgi:very-short-patch-repair endonuclease